VTAHTEVGVGVGVLTIDSPPSNPFTWESHQSMLRALDVIESDNDVRAFVITGTGRAFTSGVANLREDQALTDAQLADYIGGFSGMLNRVEALRMPVVAAINGATVGGGLEFALACDIRPASNEAFFVAAGVNVGLIVSFWRLPRVVGLGPAKEIILTWSRYTAEQALRWGLVTEVHEPEALLPAALAKAQRIATRAPLSVEAAKSAVAQAFELSFEQGQALAAVPAHPRQVDQRAMAGPARRPDPTRVAGAEAVDRPAVGDGEPVRCRRSVAPKMAVRPLSPRSTPWWRASSARTCSTVKPPVSAACSTVTASLRQSPVATTQNTTRAMRSTQYPAAYDQRPPSAPHLLQRMRHHMGGR